VYEWFFQNFKVVLVEFCMRIWAQWCDQRFALSRPLSPDGEVLDSGPLIMRLPHSGAHGKNIDVWDSFPADSLADLVKPSSQK
jgi:hypothetical protein